VAVDTFLDPHPGWITIGGRDHLFYIAGLLLLAVPLLTARGWVRRRAVAIRRVALAVLVVQQSTLYGFYAATGWDNAESLPLHISRVSALLALFYLATGNRRVMDVLFYFGLWAWASFSYPQHIQPVTHILGWSFFTNHAIVLLMPAFATITTDWRPSLRGLWRALGWFAVYVVVAVAANALTGGNYFYQREKPLLPWLDQPSYLLASIAATAALFALGYAASRVVLRSGTGRAGAPTASPRSGTPAG